MRSRRSIDLEIAVIAERQWGIIDRGQLRALGLSPSAIDRLVWSGRLRVLHRGVYALGHRMLRPQAYRLAAARACGEGAVVSFAAGAAHWELRRSEATLIDVTVPHAGQRRRPGIRVHRHASLRPDEVTVHELVPVTTPARTLLDLAATFPHRTLERAIDVAERLELFDLVAVRAVIDAHRGRPGAAKLARTLAEHVPGSTPTRSELEELFLGFCEQRGIPRPVVNGFLCGVEVDFHWPGVPFAIEVDGWEFHHGRRPFERDHERDAILAAAEIFTLRFTDLQLQRRPHEVQAALRTPLSMLP
jgi:predicted transcriptional regulator of viral defense system